MSMQLNQTTLDALEYAANETGVPKLWLFDMINLESGWWANAKNPYASARGLLQWTDASAKAMGFKSALDLVEKNPTPSEQLRNVVTKWFKLPMTRPPYRDVTEFHMVGLLPAFRKLPPNAKLADTGYWSQDTAARNAGIQTPADYSKHVLKVAKPYPIGNQYEKNFDNRYNKPTAQATKAPPPLKAGSITVASIVLPLAIALIYIVFKR